MVSKTRASHVPVLLLSYNRPEKILRVIAALKAAGTKNIYLWSDGPKEDVPEDLSRVLRTREVASAEINWDCHLETLFAVANHGCRAGVSRALDWFFSTVEEGIVLEDDCVPHPDFFAFCSDLLERYRSNDQVMCISGDNSAGIEMSGDVSYGFARYPLVWGWATWRRAWAQNDAGLQDWASMRRKPGAKKALWPDRRERRMWSGILDNILKKGRPDSWGYVWSFSVQKNRGVGVVPRVNLVSNIGFGPDATHTKYVRDRRANQPTTAMGVLLHPDNLVRDLDIERQILGGKVFSLGGQRKRKIKNFLNKLQSILTGRQKASMAASVSRKPG